MKSKQIHTGIGAVALLFLTMVVFVPGCEPDSGFTGDAATVVKLEGEWTCDEQSEIYKATQEIYAVEISADLHSENGILIDNFYEINATASATVSGMNLYISTQTIGANFTISGSGTIASNYKQINLSYTVDDGSGTVDHVTAVYTKN
jgi:hypothetical protein